MTNLGIVELSFDIKWF